LIKKLVLVTALISAVTAAQATEVGINGGTNISSSENVWGVTIGRKIGVADVTGGFTRNISSDTYSVGTSKTLTKIGPVSVAVKGSGAFVDSKVDPDGYAVIVGAGASVPLTNKVSATVDYSYQVGQDVIKAQNGSRVTAGVKLSF